MKLQTVAGALSFGSESARTDLEQIKEDVKKELNHLASKGLRALARPAFVKGVAKKYGHPEKDVQTAVGKMINDDELILKSLDNLMIAQAAGLFSVQDMIHDGISFQDLIVTVEGNERQYDERTVRKVWRELVRAKAQDADHMLKIHMKQILQQLGTVESNSPVSLSSGKYYTLVVFDKARKEWAPQFGDYDRSTVEFEKQAEFTGQRTKIIITGDKQTDIDQAVKKLNSSQSSASLSAGAAVDLDSVIKTVNKGRKLLETDNLRIGEVGPSKEGSNKIKVELELKRKVKMALSPTQQKGPYSWLTLEVRPAVVRVSDIHGDATGNHAFKPGNDREAMRVLLTVISAIDKKIH